MCKFVTPVMYQCKKSITKIIQHPVYSSVRDFLSHKFYFRHYLQLILKKEISYFQDTSTVLKYCQIVYICIDKSYHISMCVPCMYCKSNKPLEPPLPINFFLSICISAKRDSLTRYDLRENGQGLLGTYI
jgi:hypothetical protein